MLVNETNSGNNMTFKTNLKFIALATSISALSLGVNAAESNTAATATIIWNGAIGTTVPGSNLIITGVGGGDIASGTLFVENDGTFTSSTVALQARDYTPETIVDDVTTPAEVGDVQPEASWSYMGSTVMIDGQVSTDAEVIVTDLLSDTVLELGGQTGTELKAGMIELSISNVEEVTDVDVVGNAQVSVQMSASYEASI